MEDLTNIRLSQKASDIAKELSGEYGFRDAFTFFQFAMSYALNNHLKEIDFDTLDSEYDTLGSNYNVGSIKKPGLILTAFKQIFPECTTPYRYVRVLMIYGTLKIKERLNAGEDFIDIISAG